MTYKIKDIVIVRHKYNIMYLRETQRSQIRNKTQTNIERPEISER